VEFVYDVVYVYEGSFLELVSLSVLLSQIYVFRPALSRLVYNRKCPDSTPRGRIEFYVPI
jgi:hypothetical protein